MNERQYGTHSGVPPKTQHYGLHPDTPAHRLDIKLSGGGHNPSKIQPSVANRSHWNFYRLTIADVVLVALTLFMAVLTSGLLFIIGAWWAGVLVLGIISGFTTRGVLMIARVR